jgi:multiple sugar transport system substrate-binding protein
MSGSLRVLLVGGPMYDPLYTRLAEFEEREVLRVETVVAPTHPDLNERIEAEFTSGGASYDSISTRARTPSPSLPPSATARPPSSSYAF